MDQQVDCRKPARGPSSWYSPKPSGPGPRAVGRWSRYVGDRRVLVADPEAECTPALVRDLPGKDAEPLDPCLARGDRPKLQAPRSCVGSIGKWGGDIARARTETASAPSACSGTSRSDPGSLAVAGREEGQALKMIPMQVSEQDGAAECAAEQGAGRPDAGPGVEVNTGSSAPSWLTATHEVWPP